MYSLDFYPNLITESKRACGNYTNKSITLHVRHTCKVKSILER